jgi:hypothetical protein
MLATSQITICDVCRLLDYDVSKKLCGYCGMCSSWLCEADTNNWPRRIKAAIKRRLEPGYQGLPDYPEKLQEGLKSEQPTANGANAQL